MKDPRCPFCGWEVEPQHEDGIAFCGHCKEWCQAEDADTLDPEWEAAGDLSLAAEVEAEFRKEADQDLYESDSRNYGYDDEFLERAGDFYCAVRRWRIWSKSHD